MTIRIPHRHAILSYLYFILLATVFSAFTVEGKNFLFIGVAILGWGILTFFYFRSFPPRIDAFLVFILFYMLVTSFVNYQLSQWTSIVYSVFFVLSYLIYTAFIQTYGSPAVYSGMLRTVFWLYFAGLLVCQLYVSFFGFTATLASGTVVHGLFGVMIDKGQLRYYSLASEPSYAAFIIITIYYSYLRIGGRNQSLFRGTNGVLLAALLYMLLFFGSAYGVLLLGLMLASYFGFSKNALLVYFITCCLGIAAFLYLQELSVVARIVNIAQKLDISDPHGLSRIDFNAYYRVAPLLHYIRIADVFDFQFWFGHGASASRQMIIPETFLASQGETLSGFIPAFFYDYGLLGAALVLVFIYRFLPGILSFPSAIVVLMLLNANFNTQLFWFVITCLSLNEFFTRPETAHGHQQLSPAKQL